jgi:peptide/nickel transport system substrate-binding protein
VRLTIVVALTLLGACQLETDRAKAGGSLVIVTPGDADVLLPPVTTTTLGAHVSDRIFPRLAELTLGLNTVDDSGFVPSLARSWSREDSLTLVFRLDAAARWQDGVPVTARDVSFTFDVYRDSAVASPLRANLGALVAVEAEDSLTAVFRFARVYPEQLYDATYHMRILPRHLLDTIPRPRLASSSFGRTPVGAGPFRFVRWVPGHEIVLEADTGWFRGRPHLDRIVWRVVPDVAAGVTTLLAGDADAMETIPQRDQIERVRADTAVRLVPYPSPFLAGIAFNLRRPPFDDRDVRRAVVMAIDRLTIVRSVFGDFGEVPVGAAPPFQWVARESVGQLPFDTAAASRLLESRGWRDSDRDGLRDRGGRTLRFELLVPTTSRTRQQAAVLVQEQLRRVGVGLRIVPIEFTVMEERGGRGDFDAVFFSRTLDPSPAGLTQFWSSEAVGAGNVGGYRSPSFDSLVRAAAAAPGRSGAAPLYRAALELLNQDAAAAFVFAPRTQAAVHRRFENVSIRPDSWLATVADWRVSPSRRLPRDSAPP